MSISHKNGRCAVKRQGRKSKQLTNKAIESKLEERRVREGRSRLGTGDGIAATSVGTLKEREGKGTDLNGKGCLADTSITKHGYSPLIHSD